jgi:hypothetical protein
VKPNRFVESVPSFFVGRRLCAIGVSWLALTVDFQCNAQAMLDKVDKSLHIESSKGFFQSDLSGLLDLEGYYIDQNPPGLLFPTHDFFNPRLSLYLDTHLGPHLYSSVQVRFDRGFDPGAIPGGDVRFDEYFLRYTPFDDARLNLQAGKFATVAGNWVSRHDSWNNPFINAPLPYENVVAVTDASVPASSSTLLARQKGPDKKAAWLPIIWGPSYATGASIFGLLDRFEYALEVKNASLSSRPSVWDARAAGWNTPTGTGRIGFRPNAAWNIGTSVSYGGYLSPGAEQSPGFPIGKDYRDYNQLVIGQDITYAWHHWQFWAEAFASRFEIPNTPNVETLSYYVEAKYKFTPNLFGALRWNEQFFDKIPNGTGSEARWDKEAWRVDTALGYRFTRHIQTKLQYSYNHEHGLFQQGEQLVAAQLTVKF